MGSLHPALRPEIPSCTSNPKIFFKPLKTYQKAQETMLCGFRTSLTWFWITYEQSLNSFHKKNTQMAGPIEVCKIFILFFRSTLNLHRLSLIRHTLVEFQWRKFQIARTGKYFS